ncbi:MAG: ankyrin repeat domain-containing protein [Candidatus Korobacteraceae bacterium]
MAEDIFTAIRAGDNLTVARLIEGDPSLAHAQNPAGVSALMQARYENKLEIVALLRSAVGELDVHEATALGDVSRLQTLLSNDLELVNSRSNDGFTPLHLACFFGHLQAAEILIRNGADPNALSTNQIAIIHSAAASRNAEIVKLVLAAGTNPNSQQQGGYTALQGAALHNNVAMVRALLEAGANPSIANDEGLTAADLAAKQGAKEVAELLNSGKQRPSGG